MNKKIYLIILLLTCRICNAQNLVSNGDFEQHTTCPSVFGQFYFATGWYNPSAGTPDYYHACSPFNIVAVPDNDCGFQMAHSDSAYGGIITYDSSWYWREYLETQLTSTLISNACYHFEMYVSAADNAKYATDDFGVYFSNTLISGITTAYALPFTPQINNTAGFLTDTLNWTLISGNYTAVGGENYIIIGNFKNNANTNFIIINPNGTHAKAYFYLDDVSLTPCTAIEEQNQNSAITIYPNPAMDKLNVTVNAKELSEILLYDIASRIILQQKFTNSVSLNTERLAKGLYLYEVRSKDGLCKKGKVVKD